MGVRNVAGGAIVAVLAATALLTIFLALGACAPAAPVEDPTFTGESQQPPTDSSYPDEPPSRSADAQEASQSRQAMRAPRDPRDWSSYSKTGRDHLLFKRYPEAEEAFTAALEATHDLRPTDVRRKVAIRNLARLGDVYWQAGRRQDYARVAELVIASMERDFGRSYPDLDPHLVRLGAVHADRSKNGRAEELLTRALEIRIQERGENDLRVASVHTQLGTLYLEQNRLDEAEESLERARFIVEENLGPSDPAVAAQLAALAPLRRAQGRPADAERLLRRALEIQQAANASPRTIGLRENDLAYQLVESGRNADATELARSALAHLEEAGATGPALGAVLDTLALSLQESGELEQAAEYYERAIAAVEGLDPSAIPWRGPAIGRYADVLRALGREKEAAALEARFES